VAAASARPLDAHLDAEARSLAWPQ